MFDRFHQADVAFLDQVGLRQAVAIEAAGDARHEAQVRYHQLAGGVEIVVLVVTQGERRFFLGAQDRHGIDGPQVSRQPAFRAQGDRNRQ